MRSALVAASLALSPAPAGATGKGATAGQLADGCRALHSLLDGQEESPNISQEDATIRMARAGLCSGYTQGVITGYVLAGSASGAESSTNLCMPEEVMANQLSRMVVKHVQDHPETEHEDATKFIVTLLLRTFPCNK